MFGESPQAIPYSFSNTRFPAVEDKMKHLQKDREEALTAHELAQTMIEQRKTTFTPFQKGDMVWLDLRNLKTIYHKKNGPQTRRTVQDHRGSRTGHISAKITIPLESPQRLSRLPLTTV